MSGGPLPCAPVPGPRDVEPPPLEARVRVLPIQGIGHPYAGKSRRPVIVMQWLIAADVSAKFVPRCLGQQGRAVFVTLPRADEHESLVEVDVFDTELAAFGHAQSAAVDEPGHDSRHPSHGCQQGACFGDAQDDGKARSALGRRCEREPLRLQPEHFAA